MMQHSVIFRFKPQLSDTEKAVFFDNARKLSTIPGVRDFDIVAQISPKNSFDYGILMAFDTAEHYEKYTTDPDHLHFVEHVWLKSVADFLEIDYQPLDNTLG